MKVNTSGTLHAPVEPQNNQQNNQQANPQPSVRTTGGPELLMALNRTRADHLNSKNRAGTPRFQHGFQTSDLVSRQQAKAKSADELEAADQAALDEALKNSRVPETNNLNVADDLREFNAIRQSLVNEHLKKKLIESGCTIHTNDGNKDNCAFHSIAIQLMPPNATAQSVLQCAIDLREEFNGTNKFKDMTGMIHLEGEVAAEIARIASKRFNKNIRLTIVSDNPEKFKVDESIARQVKDGITEMQRLANDLPNAECPIEQTQKLAEIVHLDELNQKAASGLMTVDANLKMKDLLVVNDTYSENVISSGEIQQLVVWNQGNHYVGITKTDGLNLGEIN